MNVLCIVVSYRIIIKKAIDQVDKRIASVDVILPIQSCLLAKEKS